MKPKFPSTTRLLTLMTGLLLTFLARTSSAVSVKIEVGDNLAANQYLFNISSLSPAIPTPPSSGFSRVMMDPHRFASSHFTVDKMSRVRTLTAIDRDQVCRQLGCCQSITCSVNFTVFIWPPSSSGIKVEVNTILKDENDNPPVVSPENITIPESAKVGSKRALLPATDKDSDFNGVDTYSIADPTGTFGLHMESATRPMLEVLKKLDADDPARRSFVLLYKAYDKGSPTLVGQVELHVRILDENDNPPVFSFSSRSKWVNENASVGTELYRFRATDGDIDPENKRVSFHLDPAASTPVGIAASRFNVNASTGAVTVRSPLDYDTASERTYHLVVEARDHGSPSLSATATLTINLRNVNDNDPRISVTSSQPLEEERAAGQVVRTISVSDPDQLTSINVKCVLEGSPGFKIQLINGQHMFDLVTTQVFDFEKTPRVNVTIACTDQTPPKRTMRRTLVIPVTDINDHAPVFSPATYIKETPENAPLNSEVFSVSAKDKDSGNFGKVWYSLDADGRRYFKIDNETGTVYVRSPLDRESDSILNFKVWAADLASPRKAASAPVQVTVTDVNDNPPILDGPKAVDVVENSRPGTIITKVRFRDPDEGRNGQVVFRLIRDNNLSLRHLNMTSDGTVVVLKPIDREKNTRMYLDIQARDRGTPVMETTVSLIVRVLDLNDNRPRLVSPENGSTLGRSEPFIRTSSVFNTTVVELKANDPDLRENGSVSFEVIDTNATGMFKLDPDTGRLSTAWSYPSTPGPGFYQLRIRMSDRGRPPLSSEATIYIIVGLPVSAAGISNIIILVLILIASIAIATALVMAILWARSRNKRSAAAMNRSPDYAEYDPAVKKPRSVGDSETVSNIDLGSGLAMDPMADSASTLARSQKTPSRLSQYADYVIPYPPMTTIPSKRDSRSPHSFETFGHQSPVGQTFAMEQFASVGRPGATSPASYQQRPGAYANAHLIPEMYEDDPRQSELSYDDSGKGGSVDDVGRFVLAQHVPNSVTASGNYPLQHQFHHTPHRMSLRGSHPGGPGHLTMGAEATLC